jgi:hypothetical protein
MRREEKKLMELFDALAPQQQETLLAFAEFLAVRADGGGDDAARPRPITRPASETVVMAVKRLTRTYPMLDRRKLLAETSHFMAAHALEGRAAAEVIDDLEAVFARHYKAMMGDER